MRIWIFAVIAATAMVTSCTQTPRNMGAAVDNDSNVLTGGPITGVTLEDLPESVKHTLKETVPHAEIVSIQRFSRDGSVIYDFHFTEPESNPDLFVSEEGRVVPSAEKEQK